jgi:hypothetical protein
LLWALVYLALFLAPVALLACAVLALLAQQAATFIRPTR